nr:MAG TPA: hypothetical protein [Caudoviricetes sp.]
MDSIDYRKITKARCLIKLTKTFLLSIKKSYQ